MSDSIVILMISVSTFLGALGLIALLWGVKTGQFDDQSKFIDAARFDGVEELRDAAMMQEKKEEQKKKMKDKRAEEKRKDNYMPPD
ncbi:Type cbb3 cytochrome oxidase biogenesis protein CcoS, involved in heme b insertion [hydrothermal vent metagenome]|uniref:Type cbb3 cytochrome oxidase biogenesis protein CcoS, involved in heme b insertion n=1 Tax=hydrothermal vent metagenome TaxID=652676 RepID=A0A1W1ECI5_9ZZZZ